MKPTSVGERMPFETVKTGRQVMVLNNEMMESRDLTGCMVRMPDLAGRMWFHAIARERIHDDVYRFEVIQLAGRLVDAEIIASMSEMAQASVRTCA